MPRARSAADITIVGRLLGASAQGAPREPVQGWSRGKFH
jgi:hypothetical protein